MSEKIKIEHINTISALNKISDRIRDTLEWLEDRIDTLDADITTTATKKEENMVATWIDDLKIAKRKLSGEKR